MLYELAVCRRFSLDVRELLVVDDSVFTEVNLTQHAQLFLQLCLFRWSNECDTLEGHLRLLRHCRLKLLLNHLLDPVD